MQLLGHLSDLHVGRSQRVDQRAAGLCQMLLERAVDHVVVSGDLTHRGLRRELARLGHVRVFMHRGGRLVGTPVWMTAAALGARPFRELEPLAVAGAIG
jgi:Icc protein